MTGAGGSRAEVAVVIPSWNARDHLVRCLDSLAAQVPGPELFVVDNGSGDGSPAVLAERGVPHLAMGVNTGFAAAVNAGVARTRAPYVLVLNADTRAEPGALELLAAALAEDATLGGVQPRILQEGPGPPRVYSAGQALARDGRAFEAGAGQPDGPAWRRAAEIFGVCGAACLLRREMLDALGGYDERFFAFHEDVDLNARARLAGWRFAYVPEAVVHHHGNASWQRLPDADAFNVRLMARNRLATDIKVLPARSAPRVLVAELGSTVRSARRRTLRAALAGRFQALTWLPGLARERRVLRRGPARDRLTPWLGRG